MRANLIIRYKRMVHCKYIFFFLLLGIVFILPGCKVGPDYSVPVTVVPENFVEQPFGTGECTPDEALVYWWEGAFGDDCLNMLMEQTLCCNFDLRIAVERVCQARANYWVQFTGILPDFVSDFQATRYRASQSFGSQIASQRLGISPSPVQDFFQIGIDAIWEIDLFGKLRRTAASAYYAWQATAEDERGVKITVLSEVANTYINIRYFQAKLGLARELVKFSEEILGMSRVRFEAGLTNEEEVDQNISAFESDIAAMNVLEISLKRNIYSLAVLVGKMPEEVICYFNECCPIPCACGKIPETLPADLLRRRPDIVSAERTLASQTELIGVAVAELFPSISLVGSSSSFAANPLQGANIGYASDKLSKLFRSASSIWGIGALITLPVFDFGKRCSKIDVQKLITNQAYITYEKTVITALQEMEIALSTYFKDEERLGHVMRQVGADRRNLDLIKDQFQAGLTDFTQVTLAKEKWLVSENSLVDGKQAVAMDFVAIYKALGGEWECF